MEEDLQRKIIIDYYTRECIKGQDDIECGKSCVRACYILAMKKFYKMSWLEKENLIKNKIKK